jgi:hypothetical protein
MNGMSFLLGFEKKRLRFEPEVRKENRDGMDFR